MFVRRVNFTLGSAGFVGQTDTLDRYLTNARGNGFNLGSDRGFATLVFAGVFKREGSDALMVDGDVFFAVGAVEGFYEITVEGP